MTRTFAAILAECADLTGTPQADIIGPSRSPRHLPARYAVIYAARHGLGWSWPRIGRAMNRDHTSVLQAYHNKIAAWRRSDPEFRRLSDTLAHGHRKMVAGDVGIDMAAWEFEETLRRRRDEVREKRRAERELKRPKDFAWGASFNPNSEIPEEDQLNTHIAEASLKLGARIGAMVAA